MPSTFFGINIATSGMAAYNAGLTTTGHNISNMKTEGYTRQKVLQQAKDAISLRTAFGMLGSGVEATDIVSSRSDYYNTKYRQTNSTYGKYSLQDYYMENLENYFYPKEPESGSISNSLTNFFNSLEHLTTSSMDTTIRAGVTGFADTLTYYAEQTAIQMQELQREANIQIQATVKQINSFAAQIASLTKQINTIEVYGETANDLRDQRAYILDQLSELADITVTEKEPADQNGTKQFIVTMCEGVLVDTTNYHTIEVKAIGNKITQNDIDNLYELEWSYGQDFNSHSPNLGGKLQGLFEIRDGNNADNFRTTLTGVSQADKTVTLTADEWSSVGARDLAQLDIPVSEGELTIGKRQYEYSSFSVEVAADGTYTYTFHLKTDHMPDSEWAHLEAVLALPPEEIEKKAATVGASIPFRGIPYYQRALNEFLRTFSANFNEVQNKGYDNYGNLGRDLFVATGITSGQEYDMTEFLLSTEDGFYYRNGCKVIDAARYGQYDSARYSFTQITGEVDPATGEGYYNLYDSETKLTEKVYRPATASGNVIFRFESSPTEGQPACYYALTALTCAAAKDLVADGGLLACSSKTTEGAGGWEEGGNLAEMIELKSDNTMFKQGEPASFLNVLITATMGVDAERVKHSAENIENILHSVDNRRTSECGVDEDEEGQNLVIYQNLLNYQYRVLSVMNEVLDKLINGTAI